MAASHQEHGTTQCGGGAQRMRFHLRSSRHEVSPSLSGLSGLKATLGWGQMGAAHSAQELVLHVGVRVGLCPLQLREPFLYPSSLGRKDWNFGGSGGFLGF